MIEVDACISTAIGKYRRLPETLSCNIDYKQSSLDEIKRYLASNSIASKHNSLVVSYFWDEITWDFFVNSITLKKLCCAKVTRVHKGPLMTNQRENHNIRRAKTDQFTQKGFQQNWKATVSKILDDTLVTDNKDLECPDIQAIENLCASRLEEGNTKDDLSLKLHNNLHGEHYDRI